MCCDGWDLEADEPGDVSSECEYCGTPTVNGHAAYGCNYSPVICEECGAAPCDNSC